MTVIARRIIAIPARSASEAWRVIVKLLAPNAEGDANKELLGISGIASSLIAAEAIKEAPIVVYGSGPRVRIYCLYDEEATVGEEANETALAFDATEGNWTLSLPCPEDDLEWIQEALKKRSGRITARDMSTAVESEEAQSRAGSATIKVEAFLRS
jgi:hypothetical protein